MTIAFIYMLSVLTDRSCRWACNKRHWPLWARHLPCPSYSQLMRRLQSPPVEQLLEQVNQHLRRQLPRTREKVCDGKALSVGGFSKDPEATRGKVPAGWGRGYKLHLITDACGAVDAWDLRSLHEGEATVTRRLLEGMSLHGAILRGDGNFDSNPTYDATQRAGGRLVANRRKPGRSISSGHRQHPDRLRAIEELEQDSQAADRHRRRRNRIEQSLAHLGNLPFGLGPLPNHVRRLKRVRRWVAGKLLLYHLHLSLRPQQRLAA